MLSSLGAHEGFLGRIDQSTCTLLDTHRELNTTVDGDVCQSWTSMEPHDHSETPENFPGRGLGIASA